jgi:hypothetical protein
MNRTQLEHIIPAASQISGDAEIVVVGSQAIHAQRMRLPPIVFQSDEADLYPRNYPERADEIDAAIGELSPFHDTHGYYGHGVSPTTAILPEGWEQRVVRLSNTNTGGATGLCIDVHDIVLSKYAAGRERDIEFNRERRRAQAPHSRSHQARFYRSRYTIAPATVSVEREPARECRHRGDVTASACQGSITRKQRAWEGRT